MAVPPHERAPPDLPASAGEPRRSEALEAELGALEAILPAESPSVAPGPGVATDAADDRGIASPPGAVPPPARD